MKKSFFILGILLFTSSLSYSAERNGDILDQEDYDPDTPYYQVVPTSWSVGLRAAVNEFPSKNAIGSVYELFFEKHLMFQKIGVLSAGLHTGVVPLDNAQYGNLKYGALLRYQLHVFKNQIIVPTVAGIYEFYRMTGNSGAVHTYSAPGLMYGAMLNLGFFDRETAREGNQSIGLNRTYLTLDFRPLDMSGYEVKTRPGGASVGDSGTLWYMGIRMEFE